MLTRSHVMAVAVALALIACQSQAVRQIPVLRSDIALAPVDARTCEHRSNETLASVEQCIQRRALWHDLEAFQLIANANPSSDGHGNRDTGTPGYRASVAYVVREMREAGYAVTVQRYIYKKQEELAPLPSRGAPRTDTLERRTYAATHSVSDVDYNVIADSRFGDPGHIVVVDAHLDSIYGAGMLDNASGSATILEVAKAMAKTQTRNRLRFVWFGGEELGLLGSRYYTTHLTREQRKRILFDVDVDVTATPNFDLLVADPKFATRAKEFPPNVIPESRIGNEYFYDFFQSAGAISRPAWFGNDGTDSLAFSFAGVPNTGVLTQQDCCKHAWETRLWGGFLGDYEGKVPGFHASCVDHPNRWCDNLYNNDPFVLELVSKSVAYVTFELANRRFRW